MDVRGNTRLEQNHLRLELHCIPSMHAVESWGSLCFGSHVPPSTGRNLESAVPRIWSFYIGLGHIVDDRNPA